jgi:sugar phosphate isomerase/epimerase
MKLAFSNYVYEVARWPIEKTLESAHRFGFTYTEFAPVGSVELPSLSVERRREIIKIHKDYGFRCAQLLLINVRSMTSPDASARLKVLDYMKECCEFQLELGGRQVLVCGGCGLLRLDVPRAQAWVNSIDTIRKLAEWGLDKGILVDLEIEPQVYFLLNNTDKAARMVEDIGMCNVFVNIDIGHFALNREPPGHIEKLKSRIIQIHLSETEGLEHTNSILGTGCVDFRAYLTKAMELGIEENCARAGVPCVAGVELGDMTRPVDDPERWVRESLEFLGGTLPEVKL